MYRNAYVIVPCFNEGETIRETVASLVGAGYRVIVVDDGSVEDIYGRLRELRLHYLRHEINLGQGAALQTGMDYAAEQDAEIVVHFDADGQHRVGDIPGLIQPILDGAADVVLGSRFLSSADRKAIPRRRRMVLRVARLVNGMFTGLWLTDAHNGMRALNRKALRSIRLEEDRMAHATEILRLIRKNRLRYCERPTHIVYSAYSRRKGQTVLNAINIVFDLILSKIE